MGNSKLIDASIEIAVNVVNFCKWLMNEKKEFIMSKQLLRSGTSIGANIHEAYYASSRTDFIYKMQIALKEAPESEYWLIVLQRTGYFDDRFIELPVICSSLARMLTATLNTAKARQAEELSDRRRKKQDNV